MISRCCQLLILALIVLGTNRGWAEVHEAVLKAEQERIAAMEQAITEAPKAPDGGLPSNEEIDRTFGMMEQMMRQRMPQMEQMMKRMQAMGSEEPTEIIVQVLDLRVNQGRPPELRAFEQLPELP